MPYNHRLVHNAHDRKTKPLASFLALSSRNSIHRNDVSSTPHPGYKQSKQAIIHLGLRVSTTCG